MSMMVIGLLFPILRQRWRCQMYDIYWLPDGCCLVDRNTWNTIPVSEQKNTLNNWIIEQRTESNKRKQNEQKSNNKLALNKTDTELLSVLMKRLNRNDPILAWVIYLCDYGTDNCNPVCLNGNYEKSFWWGFLCLLSRLMSSLLKNSW
jgi:hypothetical protein